MPSNYQFVGTQNPSENEGELIPLSIIFQTEGSVYYFALGGQFHKAFFYYSISAAQLYCAFGFITPRYTEIPKRLTLFLSGEPM